MKANEIVIDGELYEYVSAADSRHMRVYGERAVHRMQELVMRGEPVNLITSMGTGTRHYSLVQFVDIVLIQRLERRFCIDVRFEPLR